MLNLDNAEVLPGHQLLLVIHIWICINGLLHRILSVQNHIHCNLVQWCDNRITWFYSSLLGYLFSQTIHVVRAWMSNCIPHITMLHCYVSMPVSLICHVGKSGPWMMFILSTPICCSLNALSDAYPRVVRCVETVAISLRHQFVESAEKLKEVNEMFTHWALRTVVSVLRLEYFENSIKKTIALTAIQWSWD